MVVISSKTIPTAILYLNKTIIEVSDIPETVLLDVNIDNINTCIGIILSVTHNEPDARYSSNSSLLPIQPNYNIVYSQNGTKLCNVGKIFDDTIYKNPNLYTMIDIPDNMRVKSLRIGYIVTVTYGSIQILIKKAEVI